MDGSQPPPSQPPTANPVGTVAAAPPQQYPAVYQVPQQQPTPGVQFVPAQPAMFQQPMQPGGQTVMSSAVEYSQPSHHLVLTVVVTAICALTNLTSLLLGIPAFICAIMAYNALTKQHYAVTKRLGYAAVVISVFNVVYTGIATIIVVGVAVGCSQIKRYYIYGDHYYSRCDGDN